MFTGAEYVPQGAAGPLIKTFSFRLLESLQEREAMSFSLGSAVKEPGRFVEKRSANFYRRLSVVESVKLEVLLVLIRVLGLRDGETMNETLLMRTVSKAGRDVLNAVERARSTFFRTMKEQGSFVIRALFGRVWEKAKKRNDSWGTVARASQPWEKVERAGKKPFWEKR